MRKLTELELAAAPLGIQKLPRYNGLPVPYTVPVSKQGVPDFKGTDMKRWYMMVTQRLCAICGEKLVEGLPCAFIGGPQSMQSHLFVDGPMHQSCAKWVFQLCPFVGGGKDYAASTKGLKTPWEAGDRPAVMCIGLTLDFRLVQLPDGMRVLQAANWVEILMDEDIEV